MTTIAQQYIKKSWKDLDYIIVIIIFSHIFLYLDQIHKQYIQELYPF